MLKLFKKDKDLRDQKVLIFSEFMATRPATCKSELEKAGVTGVEQVTAPAAATAAEVIRAFAPYYNGRRQGAFFEGIETETRVLISTDVLSEGLNLQDASRLINYDLHWNPVRLMQRIGRVDRRLNPEIEHLMLADHPELKPSRGTVIYWNFLPPDELDRLLKLYSKVSHKTLRISKVFGIEGKKLLRPEDDFDAVKDFNHLHEGSTSTTEKMHLEYQKLLADHPGLEQRLAALPRRLFSAKQRPSPGSRAVFFCYALPAPALRDRDQQADDAAKWTEEAGFAKWYLYDLNSEKISDDPAEIIDLIRSAAETPRHSVMESGTLSEIRGRVDRHVRNTYLKQVQAPIGVKPALKAWMELN